MKGASSESSTRDAGLVPPWCEWSRGDSPILFIAPHGGRRAPVDATAPPPRLRVNDVYTPEITRELASALHAGSIINCGMDRNLLDLNRISQVRRQAPWFLELLTQEIGRIIAHHGSVELLFVHGWNTGRAICDVGIGGIDTPNGLHVADGAHVTVSESYRLHRIEALRAACGRAGIGAPVGERYSGSHRNNLLQLFTPRAAQIDHPCARRIATWVGEERINALQLELGIPLRWPGEWRRKFVTAVAAAFSGGQTGTPGPPGRQADLQTHTPGARTTAALQFYDPVADVGILAGVGPAGPRVTAGRLLLFLGGQRVALFTGEERRANRQGVGGLRLTRSAGAMRLEYDGPMLLLDDAAVYLDLEAALAESRLVDADVRVDFAPTHAHGSTAAAHFGNACGVVSIAGERREVNVGAFADAAGFRASGSQRQTMLAATFGNQRAVLSRVVDGASDSSGVHFSRLVPEALRAVHIAVATDGDVYTPKGFELTCDGMPALRGQPLSRMAILRPASDAGYLRVAFGVARFEWDGQAGYGLYEYACPVGKGGSDQ
jgi:hypothetical protein